MPADGRQPFSIKIIISYINNINKDRNGGQGDGIFRIIMELVYGQLGFICTRRMDSTALGNYRDNLRNADRIFHRDYAHNSTTQKNIKSALLKVVNFILTAYVEVFRGTPMMVQAMVVFYGLVYLGIDIDRFLAASIVISLNTGAYMAEYVRGGIVSIDKGQFEAAQAIGMNHLQTMIHIVLPQVARNILPATGNQFVMNIKDSSVLSVISVVELFFTANSIAGSNYKYIEAFFIATVLYFIMTFTVTRFLLLFEKRWMVHLRIKWN